MQCAFSHPPPLDCSNSTWWRAEIMRLHVLSSVQPPVTSSILSRNISNTFFKTPSIYCVSPLGREKLHTCAELRVSAASCFVAVDQSRKNFMKVQSERYSTKLRSWSWVVDASISGKDHALWLVLFCYRSVRFWVGEKVVLLVESLYSYGTV
jgi:hypothetical protein